jgi:hypothetical protein
MRGSIVTLSRSEGSVALCASILQQTLGFSSLEDLQARITKKLVKYNPDHGPSQETWEGPQRPGEEKLASR